MENIENYGHNILKLIDLANDCNKDINFNKLKFLLQKFRNKNNRKIEICNYADYKYNHRKGDLSLIFNYEINDKEYDDIKEVLKWIKSHM